MGLPRASLLALALAVPALGLSACGGGGDELLPGETASEINANIDSVETLVAEGDCVGAEDASAAVSGQVESLSGVDPKLQDALTEGAARLNEAVAECTEEPAEEETVETVEPEEDEELEEDEKAEKPEKEKAGKEAEEEPEEGEGPTLPPNSNGKGEEKGKGNGPPAEEPETPSGGVGPGAAVEGE